MQMEEKKLTMSEKKKNIEESIFTYYKQIVDDEKTGLIIPFNDDGTELYKAIIRLFNNTDMLNEMKSLSIKKGYEFSSDRAWELLQQYQIKD